MAYRESRIAYRKEERAWKIILRALTTNNDGGQAQGTLRQHK